MRQRQVRTDGGGITIPLPDFAREESHVITTDR